MLNSLDFLNPGQPWPPPSEAARLQRYETNKKLWNGDHRAVWKDLPLLFHGGTTPTLRFALNVHKRISTLWADLLLSEPPDISVGDGQTKTGKGGAQSATAEPVANGEQDLLDTLLGDYAFVSTAYKVAIDRSRYGDGLFVERVEDGKVCIEAQPPTLWFPVVDRDNQHTYTAHVLAWTFEESGSGFLGIGTQTTKYLRVIIHTPGRIEHRLHMILNPKSAKPEIGPAVNPAPFYPNWQDSETTGVDAMLVIPVCGLATSDDPFGKDDYRDLDDIAQEIEIRFGQIARILDQHSSPHLAGPASALEEDHTNGDKVFRGGGRYFPLEDGENPPEYVVWDGQLEAAFREIDELIKQLYVISETSPAAFGQADAGLATSGTALRRLMQAPLAKARRLRLSFHPAIVETLQIAAQLAGGQLTSVQIEWNDGLPKDMLEQTQIEVQRYTNGLSSLESSLRRLDGGTAEDLDEEAKAIREEQANTAGMAQAGMPSPKLTMQYPGEKQPMTNAATK